MADQPLTQQELVDAGTDARTLSAFVTGAADRPNPGHPNGTVTDRVGKTYKTLAAIIALIMVAQETATASATQAMGYRDQAQTYRNEALAAGTVAGAQAAVSNRRNRRDLYDPKALQLGTYYDPNNGNKYSGAGYESLYSTYPIDVSDLAALGLPLYPTLAFDGVPLRAINFYSSRTVFNNSTFLGSVVNGAALAPVALPANTLKIVVQFNANVIEGSDSYNNGISRDFGLFDFLPPDLVLPRGAYRYVTQADLLPHVGMVLAPIGDSRYANGLYNPWRRILRRVGGRLALPDPNNGGRPSTSKSGRKLEKALFKLDDSTPFSQAEVQAWTHVYICFGYNDIFKDGNPGLPTAANIAARIGDPSDAQAAAAGAQLAPSDVANAPTMCGKLHTIISILKLYNPTLKIRVASTYYGHQPVQSGWMTGRQVMMWFRAWAKAAQEVAGLHGAGFFDHGAGCDIDENNWATSIDNGGIHLKDEPPNRLAAPPSGWDTAFISHYVNDLLHNFAPVSAKAGYEVVGANARY